jgi:hypothetical protein
MTEWTMNLPTRPGWYWYRKGSGEPQVGEISISEHGILYLWEVGDPGPAMLSQLRGYWWLGPVDAPGFQQQALPCVVPT